MTSPDVIGEAARVVTVSVVIPVYRGADTLPALVTELHTLRAPTRTPSGRLLFQVHEVVLVWDHGPDHSDDVIRSLARDHDWIVPVWLSRNFGQHAATVAGMATTGGEWIVTMDEDGQHDPADIGGLLDEAFARRADLVYGAPANRPPHSALRNAGSWLAKNVALRLLTGGAIPPFHSFRLVAGDAGRAMAAYAGPGVYLDVALSWVVSTTATVKVRMRDEGRQAANYRYRALLSHFWRLVLSSGNRPLRIVSGFGAVCAAVGVLTAAWLVIARLSGATEIQGWTSIVVITLVIGGLVLLALGVIAEYVGLAASMSMGKPHYVRVDDPASRFDRRG